MMRCDFDRSPGTRRSNAQVRVTSLAAALVLLAGGCSSLSTEYGKSKGNAGRKSLNGFGALRATYDQAGYRIRDVTRLSDRVRRTDVIVWTPQTLRPVSTKVTRWFDSWLRRGRHTLVYIVPDSGSETDYWLDAAKLAPPEQRLEYRKRAARSINERMKWRLNRANVQSNGWFRVESLVTRDELGDVQGPWDEDVSENSDEKFAIAAEYRIEPYDADQAAAAKAANKAAAGGAVPAAPTGPTGPGSTIWPVFDEVSQTKTQINYRSVLKNEAGQTIVAEVTSNRWRQSRILVVAGGSLLTNYAYTRPFNRRLAEKLVSASTPPGNTDLSAGFLTSNWQSIPVSERKPGAPQASGMELLTVWPLSIVTTHGLMLGLVVCLMLWPTFGRPRHVDRANQSDFGDHLDAVAALMNKAGGEDYARARISEYRKRMHGESSGPWVLPDSPASTSTPLLGGSSKPSSTSSPNTSTAPAQSSGSDSGSLLDDALASDDFGLSDELDDESATATASDPASSNPFDPSSDANSDDSGARSATSEPVPAPPISPAVPDNHDADPSSIEISPDDIPDIPDDQKEER